MKIEIEDIQEKYKRYTNQIENERVKEGIILKVKTNFMPSKLKNIYYYVYDTIMYIIDLSSNFNASFTCSSNVFDLILGIIFVISACL